MWHKYINVAVLNYNTSYHTSFGCEPSRVIHGRILYNVLNLKLRIRPQQQPILTSQIAQDVLEQTKIIHQDVRKNTMQAYVSYKTSYDKKASASKLKEADYVYILQPKTDHPGSKIQFTEFCWTGPYIIEKVLPVIIRYAKLAPTRSKCKRRECVSSHSANHQLTYQSSRKNINPIPK